MSGMAFSKYCFRNTRGFSLTELMVCLAIGSFLAVVGHTKISGMIVRARQVEAKAHLIGIYTLEKAFFSEYNGYSSHLLTIGYIHDGKARYNAGFHVDVSAAVTAPDYPKPDASGDSHLVGVCKKHRPCLYLNSADIAMPGYTDVSNTSFTAGAAADFGGYLNDEWAIDEDKNLRQISDGSIF